MKFLNLFKNKSVAFYLFIAAGVVSLVGTVIYAAYSGSAYGKINGGSQVGSHFNALIFVLMLLGSLTCVLPVLKSKWKFTPIIPIIFSSAAFGYYIDDRLVMIEEHFNHIYGMMESGGNLITVMVIFVFMLISAITLIVASFMDSEKNTKHNL